MQPLLLLAACSAAWALVAAMLMVGELQRRHVRISWIWIRFYLPKYIHQYRQITASESGRPGGLFYHFVIPINLAWIFLALGLIARRG